LRHRARPRRRRIADAGAGAIGALHDRVRAGEVDRHRAVLDDLQRALGGERVSTAAGRRRSALTLSTLDTSMRG